MKEYSLYTFNDKYEELLNNCTFLSKFFEEAFDYYQVKYVIPTPKQLETIKLEYLDPLNPNKQLFDQNYLDFDRSFKYIDAAGTFIESANEFLAILENPKYMKFYTSKKSTGSLVEARQAYTRGVDLLQYIKVHFNTYKYDYFSKSWYWAFNRWNFSSVLGELEECYARYPGATELFAFCLRDLYDKVIYVRDDDPLWMRYKAKVEAIINGMRLGAIGLVPGDQKVIERPSEGTLEVVDLRNMIYMNNIVPLDDKFMALSAEDLKGSIILKHEYGSAIKYAIDQLIRPDPAKLSPYNGLSPEIIKKYTTISPFVDEVRGNAEDMEDPLMDMITGRDGGVFGSAEEPSSLHDIKRKLIADKAAARIEYKIFELYEPDEGPPLYRKLQKINRVMPHRFNQFDVEKEEIVWWPHTELINESRVIIKFNEIMQEEINRIGFMETPISYTMTGDRNISEVDRLRSIMNEKFAQYWINYWPKRSKEGDNEPNRQMLNFLQGSKVIEEVITADIQSKLGTNDFHFSLVNRNILRLKALRDLYRRCVNDFCRKYMPAASGIKISKAKEYYDAITADIIKKMSDDSMFDNSRKNIKQLALESHIYNISKILH